MGNGKGISFFPGPFTGQNQHTLLGSLAAFFFFRDVLTQSGRMMLCTCSNTAQVCSFVKKTH